MSYIVGMGVPTLNNKTNFRHKSLTLSTGCSLHNNGSARRNCTTQSAMLDQTSVAACRLLCSGGAAMASTPPVHPQTLERHRALGRNLNHWNGFRGIPSWALAEIDRQKASVYIFKSYAQVRQRNTSYCSVFFCTRLNGNDCRGTSRVYVIVTPRQQLLSTTV